MIKIIKNNPKKTIFGISLLGYGIYYGQDKFREYQYRRFLCAKAKVFADQLIKPTEEVINLTIILNPVSSNRKGSKLFYKNVFPLLNLSGYKVHVVELDKKEEAKHLMSVLKITDQDCLVVAGGDGTLLEVVTGLMRRKDLRNNLPNIPLLVIPLGGTNQFFKDNKLVNAENILDINDESVRLLREGQLISKKCLQISRILTENENETTSTNEPNNEDVNKIPANDIFALSGIEWSLDRDIGINAKRKWLFGPFRYHVHYFFTGLLGKYNSENKSMILYYNSDTCEGNCSNNQKKDSLPVLPDTKRLDSPILNTKRRSIYSILSSVFSRKKSSDNSVTQTLPNNKNLCKNCLKEDDTNLQKLTLDNIRGVKITIDNNKLKVRVDQKSESLMDHVQTGLNHNEGIDNINSTEIYCSRLKLIPSNLKENDRFYIDNEQLNVVPIDIKLLNDSVYVYSKKPQFRNNDEL